MLGSIPGLELVEPAEQAICCGSAGIYNLVQPEAAAELGERKAANVSATGADAYASANPGCLVQVSTYLRRAGAPLPALHPVEILDASIRGVGAERAAGLSPPVARVPLARRAVVFSQADHARFSAAIAAVWGNEQFESLPLDLVPFVRGVALHDRGYGELDTDGIDEVADERWIEIQRESFRPRGEDPVVDLVVALGRRTGWSRGDGARGRPAGRGDGGKLLALHERRRAGGEGSAAARLRSLRPG